MPERIAILSSTRPLRTTMMRSGRLIETLDSRTLSILGEKFDLVIIASNASAKFYIKIRAALTMKNRTKFRMYSKAYFDEFAENVRYSMIEGDPQNLAWQEILKENHIKYEVTIKTEDANHVARFDDFSWKELDRFVTDERVTIIKSRDQILAEG